MKKKELILIVLIAIVLVGILISGYFILANINKCDSKECFNQALVKCSRESYLQDSSETSILYKILGKGDNSCRVNVQLVQFKQGTAELSALQGQEMICSIPLGVVVSPESNIQNCHGLLKESIQQLIIQRMHSQIVENLGKISAETTKIL